MTDTLEPIKTELFRNIESLVNEIELSFDEINVDQMNKYIRNLKKGDQGTLDTFVKESYTHLHEYEKQLSLILFSDKKIRTPEYKFVDDIKLFKKGDNYLLNFSLFSKENKNTKKSLLKYIYNIYMSCFFLQSTGSSNELTNFLSNITKHTHSEPEQIEEISIPSTLNPERVNTGTLPDKLPDLSGLMGGLGGMGGLEDLMSSLMNNSDIMNIANEISNDMKNETLNPMELMTSMMSGNMTDGPLASLMSKIQTSVNSKISSGEINEAALQEQAHNIINKVQETPGLSNIPGLSDILNKKL